MEKLLKHHTWRVVSSGLNICHFNLQCDRVTFLCNMATFPYFPHNHNTCDCSIQGFKFRLNYSWHILITFSRSLNAFAFITWISSLRKTCLFSLPLFTLLFMNSWIIILYLHSCTFLLLYYFEAYSRHYIILYINNLSPNQLSDMIYYLCMM